MPEILTRCGNRCDLCPAYRENIQPETKKREISDGWFRYFGFRIPPDQIECAGCLNKGKHPDANCPVRPCADCDAFGCDKLKSRMEFVETVLPKFDAIPEKDFRIFFLPYLSRERLMRKVKQHGSE